MYEAVPAENGALVDAHSSLLFTNGLYALSAVLALTGPGHYALLAIPTGVTRSSPTFTMQTSGPAGDGRPRTRSAPR